MAEETKTNARDFDSSVLFLKCSVCGTSEKLLRCARCKTVAYCGREHQIRDWKIHRRACKPTQQTKTVENEPEPVTVTKSYTALTTATDNTCADSHECLDIQGEQSQSQRNEDVSDSASGGKLSVIASLTIILYYYY